MRFVSQQLIIKNMIFDMDGVITNTMPDHLSAWKTVLAENGVFVSRHEVYQREGQQGFQSVKELFAAHGKTATKEQLKKILARKEALFKSIVRVRFIEGARSFLKLLKKSNIRLALVTGTSRSEVEKILPPHLFDMFDVIVTGSDVRNGKPDPEPYWLCLKQLRAKRTESLVIENAPFGIQSAKAAGLRCFALTTSLPREYLRQADQIFSSYRDLRTSLGFLQKP